VIIGVTVAVVVCGVGAVVGVLLYRRRRRDKRELSELTLSVNKLLSQPLVGDNIVDEPLETET
jgi:hypothetical protein